ncbi:MAG: ATPase, partial [Cetobacterium sp.]
GTLTLNQMTVKKIYVNDTILNLDESDLANNETKLLIEGMVLNNDATSTEASKTGDPTEIALIDAGIKFNIFRDELNTAHPRVNELPFDSDRKLMSTVNKYNDKFYVFTKGAIDSIFKVCNKILINGNVEDLTDEMQAKILTASNVMSDDALRVLTLAYKEIDNESIEIDHLEKDLTFVGFVGMIDPPRDEVKPSIVEALKAGITPVMITG